MAPLKVLSALDSARTQFYHFKAIIIAGMGLFTNAYDLFCIPPIMQLIGRVYFENEPESREYQIQPAVLSTLLGIALLGTVIGQLVFGWFRDRIRRRKMYGLASIIVILILMLGAVPAGLTCYWQMTMPEIARY